MMEWVDIRFFVSLLYLAAGIAYVLLFFNCPIGFKTPAAILLSAVVFHFFELLARGAEAGAAGGAPFTGLSGFLSLFSFLVACVYLMMERRYKLKPLGAFQVPIVFAIQCSAAIFKHPVTSIDTLKTGHLFMLHVIPVILAYAALTVSFVAAVAFLLLERQLKRKHFGLLMRNLPNLGLVERVNAAGVKIGLPLLALGALAGILMGYRAFGLDYRWDMKNWYTIGVVLLYAAHPLFRRFSTFRGKRTVIISVFGYVAVIFGFTVVDMIFSTTHSLF
jgi:ABC-type transport system involved in cytochrome c biogenesis permease subunit